MTNKDLYRKMKENECYLIGQIPLNEEEINDIMLYAKNIINLDDKFMIEGPDLVLSTALVQIAINEYQDGKYWEFLANKFNLENIPASKQGMVGRIFISTLREYKLFELKESASGANRYVENIKAHAFVTNNYMEGFFDFLKDYYENNLFRDIANGVEETLQDLSDFMKHTVKQNTDTIYSAPTGKTKKSYKLLKSTREVIAQCTGNLLYQLLYPSLKIIDDNFFDGILPQDLDNRFSKLFVEWYQKKNIKEEYKTRVLTQRKFYSHKPFLNLNTNKYVRSPFTLIIPRRRYRSTECNGEVSVVITINDISRPAKQLEVSTNMGTYISEEYRYQVNYPFDEIKIEISSLESNEIIISAKDYAIFNEECVKVNRFEKGINYLLTKPGANIEFSEEDILIEKEEFEEWTQYKLNIAEDSICYIDNKPLTIIGEFSKEPVFEYKVNFCDIYDEKGKKIIATRLHPLISFEMDKDKMQGATIQVNNKNYLLTNHNIAKYDSPIHKNQLIISVDLNDMVEQTSGYYKVELNTPSESNKFITEYILLNNVYFLFDRPRYINETEAKLTVRANGLDIEMLDEECKLIDNNEYRNNYYYSFKLSAEYRTIHMKLKMTQSIFYIELPVKMVLHGFSENNLCYGIGNELWYSKLQQLVYIKFPGAKQLGIYSNMDFKKVIWGEEIKDNLFRVNITAIIAEIKKSSKPWQGLYIKYIDNKERWVQIYKIMKSIRIDPYFEFEFYNDVPCFNVSYTEVLGVKIFYSIEEETGNIIINHQELKPGINYLPEIKRDIFYNIIPSLEESDEFGLNSNVITMPKRSHKGMISYKKQEDILIERQFTIENINIKGEKLKLHSDYRYEIEILEKENDNRYYGKLYEYKDYAKIDGETLLRKTKRRLGDIRISNIQRGNANDFSFKMENFSNLENEWDKLYYNTESKRILECDNPILELITFDKIVILEPSNTKYTAKSKARRNEK